jgi:hypothetical protein
MKRGRVSAIIPASCEAVFDVLHDYPRRLAWDTLLRKAYLEPEFPVAAKGAISVCAGRWRLGGIALRTRYVSFERGKVAAVEMLNRPPFFGTWAASIRHRAVGASASEVTYTFHFRARPSWLAWLLEPIMLRVFAWETRKRLRALAAYDYSQVRDAGTQ